MKHPEDPSRIITSKVNKIVGLTDEDRKRYNPDLLNMYIQTHRFESEIFHQPEWKELVEVFKLFNSELKNFLATQGLKEAHDFSVDNLLVDTYGTEELDETTLASYRQLENSIPIRRLPEIGNEDSEALFFGAVTHEMIHGHSFNSVKLHKDTTGYKESYGYVWAEHRRSGVSLLTREGNEVGHWLNEALTEELNLLFHKHILENSQEYKLRIYSEKYLENSMNTAYSEERTVLLSLVMALELEFPSKFKNTVEVYALFFAAFLNGGLLPVARVIEEKMGKGSFRALLSKTQEQIQSEVSEMADDIMDI